MQARTDVIEFERIYDASVLSNFFCSIDEIDNFIHNGLQEKIDTIEGLSTYSAKINGEIVAMFSIMSGKVELDDDDKDDMVSGFAPKPERALHEENYLSKKEFDSLEIEYLAVDKNYQGKRIGEYIIFQLEEKVKRDNPNVEFLSVNAYYTPQYSAVGFYHKCGFTPIEPPGLKTQRMQKVLFPL